LPANSANISGTWSASPDPSTFDAGQILLPNPFRASAGGALDAGDPFSLHLFASGTSYADMQISFTGADGGATVWDASQYSGLQFWVKMDQLDGGGIGQFAPSITVAPSGGFPGYEIALLGQSSSWQLVYVPFCQFNAGPPNVVLPAPDAGPFNPAQLSGLAWTITPTQGISIDQVYLVK
jgi:hypothetical protein